MEGQRESNDDHSCSQADPQRSLKSYNSDDSNHGFEKVDRPVDLQFGFKSSSQDNITPSDETSPIAIQTEKIPQVQVEQRTVGDVEIDQTTQVPFQSVVDKMEDLLTDIVHYNENDNEGQFDRASPDERTYERQGPLTLGEQPQEQPFDLLQDTNVSKLIKDDFDDSFSTDFAPKLQQPSSLLDLSTSPEVTEMDEKPKIPLFADSKSFGFQEPLIDFKKLYSQFLDLIYYHDPKKSGIILSALLSILLCFHFFSVISVIAYIGLTILAGTIGFRLYKLILGQINKTESDNPFKPYLDRELNLPEERVHQQVSLFVEHGKVVVGHLRRLFLVENLLDSVKFGLILWVLTYVGAWFSGMTLLILAVIGIFTIPKFYQVYKEQIDKNMAIVRDQIKKSSDIAQENMPFLKKKLA